MLKERMSELTTGLPELDAKLAQRLATMDREHVIERIWQHDHTVWSDDPTEITRPDRLGWLDIAGQMLGEAPALAAFAAEVAADGVQDLVLLGMGGSSLAPEVMAKCLPRLPGYPRLRVLDTTVPDEIFALESEIDLAKTLFIVASKSGTTVETTSQLAYFWARQPEGRNFIAITDPGTPLASLAQVRGFRRLFLNREDMGGRYSALSYFGLVPTALTGADVQALLRRVQPLAAACANRNAGENPGAVLGALLGEAALAGRDKLTLMLPPAIAALGDWTEQLIAESTGKRGKGIVPIVGEPGGPAAVYGPDRLFVTYGDAAPGVDDAQPVVRLPHAGAEDLGAEFLRWEFATAVAGYVLGINPFDQPDVQRAKEAAERFLVGGPVSESAGLALPDLLAAIRPGDYLAIQAYLPRGEAIRRRLEAVRLQLLDRYAVATSLGFGPRYLHSTGQLHKGGPDSGVFIQLAGDDGVDIPIPGRQLTFGALKRAQAQGDFETLLSLGRRAARTSLEALEATLSH
jgi:glucose-6-phosphate isomerase